MTVVETKPTQQPSEIKPPAEAIKQGALKPRGVKPGVPKQDPQGFAWFKKMIGQNPNIDPAQDPNNPANLGINNWLPNFWNNGPGMGGGGGAVAVVPIGPPPVELSVGPPLDQGNTNGCGTTATAMALNAMRVLEGKAPDFTREMLDEGNREGNLYSSPRMLQRVVRQHGYQAQLLNHSNFDEVKSHIDQGHVMVAIEGDHKSGTDLHYVTITGYIDDPDPTQRKLIYMEPANGQRKEVLYDDYAKGDWGHVKFEGIPTGMDRMVMVVSKDRDLGPDRDVPAVIELSTWGNSAVNIWHNLGKDWQAFDRMVTNVWNGGNLRQEWNRYWPVAAQCFRSNLDNLEDGVVSTYRAARTGVEQGWDAAKQGAQQVLNKAEQVANQACATVKQSAVAVVNLVDDGIDTVCKWLD